MLLRVGGNKWEEANEGEYVARCSKIDSDYKFMQNRKLAIYFVIVKGPESGKRAILFYNKLSQADADEKGTDFGVKSKLFTDVKKLFPDTIGDGTDVNEINSEDLFLYKEFRIKVKRSNNDQAIVTDINHHLGF